MFIKNVLQNEINRWEKVEIFALSVAFLTIIVNAILFKDSFVAIVSAVCGILYTTLAGKGRVSCYFFGLSGSGCYSWLSFHNALYGNLILYLCYYVPMQILGIFKWKKHLQKASRVIVKTCLNKKEFIVLFFTTVVACVIAVYVLEFLHSKSPFLDGITTVLSVVGMYLTVRRCIEQWIVWMVVNGISFYMWLELVLNGTKAYATLVMWGFYFAAAIYFYFQWKKEIENKINV